MPGDVGLDASQEVFSYRERICLGDLPGLPDSSTLKWNKCHSPVNMDDGVKLSRKPAVEVMAKAFRVWSIDHTDCSLKTWLVQRLNHSTVAQGKKKSRNFCLMKKVFEACFQGRTDNLSFCRALPLGSRSNFSRMSGEANQKDFLT